MDDVRHSLLHEIVAVRERRLQRANSANQHTHGAVTPDEVDCLLIQVLQARLDLAEYEAAHPVTTPQETS